MVPSKLNFHPDTAHLLLFTLRIRPLDGIRYLCETKELLCRLENVTRASINIGVSSKWVKFQSWANCIGLFMFS